MPPTASGVVTAAVQTEGLGAVRGEWVFALNRVPPQPSIGPEDHEVWAISADGSATKRIVKYKPVWGGPVNVLGAVTDNLARQLSPDGRKLLVAASTSAQGGPYRIISIEVATGSVAILTHDPEYIDLEPAWAPDGALVALQRFAMERREREVWVMRPDGTGLRRVATASGSLFGFSADGRDVCFLGPSSTYACAEVSTGRVRMLAGTVTIRRPIGSAVPSAWRSGSPAFVGSFGPQPRIDVADGIASGQRTLTSGLSGDVRWRPKADEVLVTTLNGDDWGQIWRVKLDGTRQKVATALVARRAEWTADGAALYVIAAEGRTAPPPPALPPGTSVHRVDADGGSARELFRSPREMAFGLFDITSFIYR